MLLLGFGWFGLSAFVTALISLIGMAHQGEEGDPLEDLTFRLRKPIRWSIQHPVRAIMRRR